MIKATLGWLFYLKNLYMFYYGEFLSFYQLHYHYQTANYSGKDYV